MRDVVDVRRRAKAWQIGGHAGVAAVVSSWVVPKQMLDLAAVALGPGARRKDNRVSLGDVQLRIDDVDGRWHPFMRVDGQWQLAGAGHDDPASALAAIGYLAD